MADGLGRSISVPLSPSRVVSLAPSVTDSLFALGFGDRVVGVSDFCVLPPGTPRVARVGGMLNPSLEAIRALRPDLLIGTTSGNDPSLASEAAALGLPLYTVHTPDVAATLRSLEEIAGLLGDRRQGVALATELRRRLEAVRSRVAPFPPARVLFLVWGEPLVVPGQPAFLTDALRLAGAVSVTADAPAAWPAFDLESAVALVPEVILTTEKNRAMADRLRHDPAWSGVPAVRRRRILVVSEAIEQPGPGVVGGIEEVARLLHPQAFRGARLQRTKEMSRAGHAARTAGGSRSGHPSAPPQGTGRLSHPPGPVERDRRNFRCIDAAPLDRARMAPARSGGGGWAS